MFENKSILITGGTGSGKSTLLAAGNRMLLERPQGCGKMLTYEAPIEYVYDSIQSPRSLVSQSEIPRHLPDFAHGVRNALRRKPEIILVGESRDRETINASIEAAQTGHAVYTTTHTLGVANTVQRQLSLCTMDGYRHDTMRALPCSYYRSVVCTCPGDINLAVANPRRRKLSHRTLVLLHRSVVQQSVLTNSDGERLPALVAIDVSTPAVVGLHVVIAGDFPLRMAQKLQLIRNWLTHPLSDRLDNPYCAHQHCISRRKHCSALVGQS